jgi:polyphosphate kinase
VDKKRARLNCIHHLLSQFDYVEVEHPSIELPERERHPDYIRQPLAQSMFVPEIY